MSQQLKAELKEQLINQVLRVTTKNGRIFEGKLKAVDFRANIILHDCVGEIPDEQNCPVNMHINNLMDHKLHFEPDPSLSPEQQE